MAKYKLLLDESGSFDNADERYLILGGVFFNEDDQQELEKIFMPLQRHICEVLKRTEMHGNDDKNLFKYIAPVIGSNHLICPIVFVIDKKESFIFSMYNKKSFKYNKAIEHLIQKMLDNNLISKKDELHIIIDNINLNKDEKKNLASYLPRIYKFVTKVEESDSKVKVSLQLADVIVNRFSKKTKCKLSSTDMLLLNPTIYCFLSSTEHDYLEE